MKSPERLDMSENNSKHAELLKHLSIKTPCIKCGSNNLNNSHIITHISTQIFTKYISRSYTIYRGLLSNKSLQNL